MKKFRGKWYANWRNWVLVFATIVIVLFVAAKISPVANDLLLNAAFLAFAAMAVALLIGIGQVVVTRFMQLQDRVQPAQQALAGANARINNVLDGIPQARWALQVPEDESDFDFLKTFKEWRKALQKIDRAAIQPCDSAFCNAVTLCMDQLVRAEWRLQQRTGDKKPTVVQTLDFLTEKLLPFRKATAEAYATLANDSAPKRKDGGNS
ncbi:MAG: hypothetical protein LKI62_09710 [Achromobacter ruhlandii]|nr:hypothetical protein [Achromobacter ruhlandii]MCI1836946.1 hypothetical protein [Achromobacter ruhlandii]